MNFFKPASSIFPDLVSSNCPPLNKPKVGYPEISYCSIISSNSSPLTLINFTSVSSLDTLEN
jgi:hypothetical protein